MENDLKSCGIPVSCERKVPGWLVFLDNLPTAVLFLLGALLVWMVSKPLAAFLLVYDFLAIILFWKRICTACPHFGTESCVCGYGLWAARYFKKREGRDFRAVFRKNIAIMFPCWFVPLGAGIYLLQTGFSRAVLALFVSFVVVAFLIIPLLSRLVGCKGCTLKEQCPWMTPGQKGTP